MSGGDGLHVKNVQSSRRQFVNRGPIGQSFGVGSAMGFGRNPHVPKAQVAEQKAADASDASTRIGAYRDAARAWDRAAEREQPGPRRDEYGRNATRNRELADAGGETRSG
jgi:hypothetical protein